MLRLILKERRAQNTLEYALMIVVIIGAFTAMQLYARRGMQARLKSGIDVTPGYIIGEANLTNDTGIFGNETQYEPYYYTKGTYCMTTTTSEGIETGNITMTGGKIDLTGAKSKRTGTQEIAGAEDED